MRVEHDGYRAGLAVLSRAFRADKIAPARTAEDVVPKGELVLEIVLLHNPRGAQAAALEPVLYGVLLEHHFLEYLRERVATAVGRVPLRFRDGNRVRVEEVPHAGVATNENE